ncbi:MAG: hypothetical protein ACYDCO_24545 [Armatimonadota bacterium]
MSSLTVADKPTASRRDPMPARLALAFGVVVLLGGALLLLTPLPVLMGAYIPDDAFYYFQTARNLAATGFSSFDGIHYTNGYQPLWFLICVPFFKLFPHGGDVPVRLILLLQLLLAALSTALVVRLFARQAGLAPAALAGAAWVFIFQRIMLNGLETSLLTLLYVLLLDRYLAATQEEEIRPGRYFGLGLLLALTFLARTDSGFLLLALPLAMLARVMAKRREWRGFLLFLLPLFLFAGGYLAYNLAATGHLMPVSGAVKQWYSAQARAEAVAAAGSAWRVAAGNLLWPLAYPKGLVILAGVTLPWLLLVLSLLPAARTALAPARRLWPFFLAATAAYLFYALMFFGPYSRTSWYYLPQVLLALLSTAMLLRLLIDRWMPRVPAAVSVAVAVLCILGIGGYTGLSQWRKMHAAPQGWNYALYVAARWARDGLPPGATVASSSAGILGYYAEHPVINTDGLVNDYAFLEEYLRAGRVTEYCGKWDYFIGGEFSPGEAEQAFPGNRTVALPPEVTGIPFQVDDSGRQARIVVLRMRQERKQE